MESISPLHPHASNSNGKHKAFFDDHPDRDNIVAISNSNSNKIFLPPSLPSAPFKLDFPMVFIIIKKQNFPTKPNLQLIISTSHVLGSASSSPEFREYMTLRKIIKQIESELITAQIYVDAEVKAYYSNIKVIVSLKCYANFK